MPGTRHHAPNPLPTHFTKRGIALRWDEIVIATLILVSKRIDMEGMNNKFLIVKCIISVAICTAVVGCGGMNVRPGDKDYPQSNPNASAVLKVHGVVESDLPVRFAAYWVTTKGTSWPVADGNCNYMFNRFEGVTDTYSLVTPVVPVKNDDHYALELNTDELLPGRCGWKFSGLLIYTDGQVFDNGFSVDAAEILVAYAPFLPRWSGMMQSMGNRMELSCKRLSYGASEAPHDGIYLKCVDKDSAKKIRVLMHEGSPRSFEVNIHRDN